MVVKRAGGPVDAGRVRVVRDKPFKDEVVRDELVATVRVRVHRADIMPDLEPTRNRAAEMLGIARGTRGERACGWTARGSSAGAGCGARTWVWAVRTSVLWAVVKVIVAAKRTDRICVGEPSSMSGVARPSNLAPTVQRGRSAGAKMRRAWALAR